MIIPRQEGQSGIDFLQQFRYVPKDKIVSQPLPEKKKSPQALSKAPSKPATSTNSSLVSLFKKENEADKKIEKIKKRIQDEEQQESEYSSDEESLPLKDSQPSEGEVSFKEETEIIYETLETLFESTKKKKDSPLNSPQKENSPLYEKEPKEEPKTCFKCLRCGYTSPYKTFLIKHLNKKKICLPLCKSVSLKETKEDAENQFAKCHVCNEKYESYKMLEKHMKTKGCIDKSLNPEQKIYVIKRLDKDNYIKIGIHSGSMGGLLTRYRTHLANDFNLVLFYQTKYASCIEEEIKREWALIRDINESDKLNEWYFISQKEAIKKIMEVSDKFDQRE